MRIIFLLTTFIIFYTANAQVKSLADKNILEEQLVQVLNDFPNHFKNLKETDSIHSKISLIGTDNRILFHEGGNSYYLSVGLLPIDTKSEANLTFYNWVGLINSLYLNGVKLKSSNCNFNRDFSYLCKKWNYVPGIDAYMFDSRYKSFTIVLEILLIGNDYAGILKIGSGDF